MPYKENRAETELAFERFWAGDFIGRPLLAVTAPRCKDVKCVPYMAGAKEKDYDKVFRDFHTYAKNIYWAGESMPAFECTFGPDQFAAFYSEKSIEFCRFLFYSVFCEEPPSGASAVRKESAL